jgi:hypothetical protein
MRTQFPGLFSLKSYRAERGSSARAFETWIFSPISSASSNSTLAHDAFDAQNGPSES